jgi:hypothetical protein
MTQGLSQPSDARTHDQIRADVLVDLLLGSGAAEPALPMDHRTPGVAPPSDHPTAHPPEPADADRGRAGGVPPDPVPPIAPVTGAPHPAPEPRPEINVVVTLETLLALSEDPAVVTGLGPIAPDVARELAADGRWRAWITNTAGVVTSTSSHTYTPSARLARLVRAREPYCRMPGCRHPAANCDLDHAIPYPLGPTAAANLGPLCRRHHNLKTHLDWHLEPTQTHATPGTPKATGTPGWRWRTPAGITITDDAALPLE